MSTTKRILLILALASSLTLLAAGVALAGGQNIPHGGYDTTTDACLQCHDIHEAGSDYVLLRWSTVRDTCASCHYLYDTDPSNLGGSFGQGSFPSGTPLAGTDLAYDPGYDPQVELAAGGYDAGIGNSLGSRTSAYEVPSASRTTHEGHRLQMGETGAFVSFSDGTTNTASYIPGGSDPLTAIQRAQYPSGFTSVLSFAGTNGLYCASCHTPHGNYGQELYLAGTTTTAKGKILSGKPNHTEPRLEISSWVDEGNKWCERCHDKRDSDPGSGHYNHPSTYCLVCHANSGLGGGPQSDFPHTSENANLLSKEPDALCIDCHKAGLLP